MYHSTKNITWTVRLSMQILLLAIAALLPISRESAANLRCSQCGREIIGQYITADDRVYHPQHFICDYCRRPITMGYQRYGNFRYHQECYKQAKAPRCIACGQPITGTYLTDLRGNPMHIEHKGQYLKCDSCQRPIVQGSQLTYLQYPDGRIACSICIRTAVETPEQVQRSETYVRQILQKYGITPPQSPITLVQQTEQPGRRGVCHITTRQGEKEYLITILHGLPQTLFEFVLAHELMHQWISQHNPAPSSNKGQQYDEGSCQLAAYFMLSESRDPDAYYHWLTMEKSPDYNYGQGYHIAKEYAKRYGIQAWLASLATPGYEEQAYPTHYTQTQSPMPTTQKIQSSQMNPTENSLYTATATPSLPQLMGSALHLLPIIILIVVMVGYACSRIMYKKTVSQTKHHQESNIG